MMASFVADKHIYSFTEPTASGSRKGSFSPPSSFLMRSRAFTDPTHLRFGDNEVYTGIPQTRFTRAALLEELMQTDHIHPHQGQRADQIRKATLHSSRTNKNDHTTHSLHVGEANDQEYQVQPEEYESVFDRLHAMPEDRQYMLERFLAEEDHPLTGDGDENVLGSPYIESTYIPPKTRRNSLDTNLLMIGAFAADFDEYRIHLPNGVYRIPNSSSETPIIDPWDQMPSPKNISRISPTFRRLLRARIRLNPAPTASEQKGSSSQHTFREGRSTGFDVAAEGAGHRLRLLCLFVNQVIQFQ
jgi:hypothetical protein